MPLQIRPVHPVSPAHCTSHGIAASQEDTKSSVDENCSRTYKRKISSHPACPLYPNSSFYTQSAFIQCSIESSDCSGAISFFSSPANLKEHPAKIPVVKFFMKEALSICFPFVAFHFIGYLCPWMMKRAIPHPKLPSLGPSLYIATITSFSFISPCSE